MTSVGPLSVAVVAPEVEYSMFVLTDSRREDLGPLETPPADDSCVLHVGREAVVLRSAGTDFYPEVSLEVWAHEPPPSEGEWDVIEYATFSAPSRRIRLVSPDGTTATEAVVPSTDLCLRAACKGRDLVSDAVFSGAAYFHGIETWVLQVWPA